LCDVGRVAVKHTVLNCYVFYIYSIFAVLLQSADSIKFLSGLNTVVFSDSSVGIHFRYVLTISLVRMRRNSVISASGVKTALTIVFSDHDFL